MRSLSIVGTLYSQLHEGILSNSTFNNWFLLTQCDSLDVFISEWKIISRSYFRNKICPSFLKVTLQLFFINNMNRVIRILIQHTFRKNSHLCSISNFIGKTESSKNRAAVDVVSGTSITLLRYESCADYIQCLIVFCSQVWPRLTIIIVD